MNNYTAKMSLVPDDWVTIAIEGVKSSTKYAAPPVSIGQFLN